MCSKCWFDDFAIISMVIFHSPKTRRSHLTKNGGKAPERPIPEEIDGKPLDWRTSVPGRADLLMNSRYVPQMVDELIFPSLFAIEGYARLKIELFQKINRDHDQRPFSTKLQLGHWGIWKYLKLGWPCPARCLSTRWRCDSSVWWRSAKVWANWLQRFRIAQSIWHICTYTDVFIHMVYW